MARKRHKGFPRYSLQGVVKVIEAAASHGRSFNKEAFANFSVRTGTASAHSGAFAMRLAALTDFGLIKQSKGTIELTELALRIAHPASEKEKAAGIREAFLNAEVYASLYQSSVKDHDLNVEAIGNIAVRQHHINPSLKSIFLQYFIASGDYAGLISKVSKDTIQFKKTEEYVSDEDEHEKSGTTEIDKGQKDKRPSGKEKPAIADHNLDRYEITLQSGERISLLLPATLSKNDKARLKQYIELIPEAAEIKKITTEESMET